MTIQKQLLVISPGHPLAKEFYDLQCVQATAVAHMIEDASKHDEHAKTLALVDEAIRFLQGQYRHECGADETCPVSLSYGPNRFPMVEGRPSDGSPFIHSGAPKAPVLN
jgi:hypothetical protein